MVKDLNDPTNVDSVPAILTPGEYVLNKEAATMYAPIIEAMNNHGLQQRHAENQVVQANIGKKISKLHGEGYTAPGQAYAIAKNMGYNVGGLVDFLKEKEGYRDKAYQDSAGVWTIGYGRTTNADGSPIRPNQTTDRETEDVWLNKRAQQEYDAVTAYGKEHGYEWTQGQKEALSSFRYNGGHGMLKSLTNKGQRDNAEIESMLLQYNKVTDPNTGKKVPIQGLTNRRNDELKLWQGSEVKQEADVPPPADAPPPPTGYAGYTQQDFVQEAQAINTPAAQQPAGPEVPADGGFRGALSSGVLSALQAGLGPRQPIMHAPLTKAPTQPQAYTPLITEDNLVQSRNLGGWLRDLIQRGSQAQDPWAGYADYNQQDFLNEAERINNPGAQVPPTPVQMAPGNQENLTSPIYNPAGDSALANPTGHELGFDPTQLDFSVPVMDMNPPPPPEGSDEDLLQNSSDAMADVNNPYQGTPWAGYGGYTQQDFVNEAQTFNNPGAQVSGYTIPNLEQPTADSLNLPIPEQDPSVAPGNLGDVTAPEQEAVPTIDKQSPVQLTETKANVTKKIAEVAANEEPPAEVPSQATLVAAGEQAVQDPRQRASALDTIKGVFGDLINGKELARMGIMLLGGMATGMSSGQALAFAGQNYLQRIDAIENKWDKLATGGKYDPASVKAAREADDISLLKPVGVAPVKTGNFETKYTKNGRKVTVEKVKVGDNVYYVDQNGKEVSGFDLVGDPSEVRGTKENRDRIKTSTNQISDQLKEMRNTFDVFDKESGSAKTDILPSTNASKIAEWAIENGVQPDELGGLVESAYHDALNDNRQDGSRARNLVPYLNQLVIRQQVGGNADVFKAKKQPKDGPPQYVNAAKLQVLNQAAANTLRSMGKQGGVNDLSNLFYTEALKDWNDMDPDLKEQWDRKARADESGFYLFVENMLLGGI